MEDEKIGEESAIGTNISHQYSKIESVVTNPTDTGLTNIGVDDYDEPGKWEMTTLEKASVPSESNDSSKEENNYNNAPVTFSQSSVDAQMEKVIAIGVELKNDCQQSNLDEEQKETEIMDKEKEVEHIQKEIIGERPNVEAAEQTLKFNDNTPLKDSNSIIVNENKMIVEGSKPQPVSVGDDVEKSIVIASSVIETLKDSEVVVKSIDNDNKAEHVELNNQQKAEENNQEAKESLTDLVESPKVVGIPTKVTESPHSITPVVVDEKQVVDKIPAIFKPTVDEGCSKVIADSELVVNDDSKIIQENKPSNDNTTKIVDDDKQEQQHHQELGEHSINSESNEQQSNSSLHQATPQDHQQPLPDLKNTLEKMEVELASIVSSEQEQKDLKKIINDEGVKMSDISSLILEKDQDNEESAQDLLASISTEQTDLFRKELVDKKETTTIDDDVAIKNNNVNEQVEPEKKEEDKNEDDEITKEAATPIKSTRFSSRRAGSKRLQEKKVVDTAEKVDASVKKVQDKQVEDKIERIDKVDEVKEVDTVEKVDTIVKEVETIKKADTGKGELEKNVSTKKRLFESKKSSDDNKEKEAPKPSVIKSPLKSTPPPPSTTLSSPYISRSVKSRLVTSAQSASLTSMEFIAQPGGYKSNQESGMLKCHCCDYQTSRINNLVYHVNKACNVARGYYEQRVEDYKKTLQSPKSNKKRKFIK